VRIAAKGFSIAQKNDLRVDRPVEFNLQLVIRPRKKRWECWAQAWGRA
jgi:hypothetical protein